MINIDINLILWVIAFTWHYSLFCGYISDDHAAAAKRKDIIPDAEKTDRGESFWVKLFNDGPLLYLQTRLFWKLGFRKMPFFWHLFSLSLHLCNTYLIYLFLTPIIGEQVALYTCAFWGINPMLNQNVVWVSGRPYLFGVLLTMVGMLNYEQPIIFIPLYLLAVITNISIFFSPLLVYITYPEAWQAKLYLAMMLVGGAPIIIWKFNKRFTKGLVLDRDNFRFRLRKFNTFAKMVVYYIWTLFFPIRMGWYHQAGFKYNDKWERFNYITLIGYLTLAGLFCYYNYSFWWFILGLLPVSNIYATNSFLQDRYVYFCSIGIAMIVAPILIYSPEVFYCVMTFYVTRAYMYSRHLKNDEKLYRENCKNHPHSDYAINNLSYFLIQQRRYDEARVVIERGLNINRLNQMLWYNLGITFASQGHFNNDEGKFKFLKALDCWKMCLQVEPRWTKPADDIKKLVKLLVENKVLTLNKDDSAHGGMQVSIPKIAGLQEGIQGN